ncbi:uncharacterized protein LOC127879781 [Dreissena polymorpha]|uniref:uncharacterized protein LOC127879781 n=1 Tax=Dreissena polymorpha TaxID=45954 RepID=UPI0022654BB5|nr:uncharacterized protein LOC127879781 [Dreissena polymorpha]
MPPNPGPVKTSSSDFFLLYKMSRKLIITFLVILCAQAIGWTQSIHIRVSKFSQLGDPVLITFIWDNTTSAIDVFHRSDHKKIAVCSIKFDSETRCSLTKDELSKDYAVFGELKRTYLVIEEMKEELEGLYLFQDAHNKIINFNITVQPHLPNFTAQPKFTAQPNSTARGETKDNRSAWHTYNDKSAELWKTIAIIMLVILVVVLVGGGRYITTLKKQIEATQRAASILTSRNLTQWLGTGIQESSCGLGTMTTSQNTRKNDVYLEPDASKETDEADEKFSLLESNKDADHAVSLKAGGDPDLAV